MFLDMVNACAGFATITHLVSYFLHRKICYYYRRLRLSNLNLLSLRVITLSLILPSLPNLTYHSSWRGKDGWPFSMARMGREEVAFRSGPSSLEGEMPSIQKHTRNFPGVLHHSFWCSFYRTWMHVLLFWVLTYAVQLFIY